MAVGLALHGNQLSWWWAPPYLIWAALLATSAVCDSATQRIPTSFLRIAGTVTVALAIVAVAVTGDRFAMVSILLAYALLFGAAWAAWKWAGMGFADVRLAALGALGMGHINARDAIFGCLTFATIAVVQAIVVYLRTRDRKATLPLAPAIAAGLLVAVAT